MARPEKTVFISYRRTDIFTALAVYQYLKNHDFDVFFDYESIQSGDFEQIIVSNIKARAHFLVILTPTALDRCNEPGDWLRREIETAISERRNIVPLFFEGFNFSAPSVSEKLTGKLKRLRRYNGLEVPAGYFSAAMERLCNKYLNVTLDAVLQPIPEEVQKVVKKQKIAADQALLRGEDHKEFKEHDRAVVEEQAKKEQEESARRVAEEKALQEKRRQARSAAVKRTERKLATSLTDILAAGKKLVQNINLTQLGIGGGILLAISIIIFAKNYIRPNSPTPVLTATTSPPSTAPFVSSTTKPDDTPTVTFSITPSITPSMTPSPVPTLGVSSTLISEVDGMKMVYVPAGKFEMGSDVGEPDEKPIHTVNLDSYWIDQTEVTNTMYANCVKDGQCAAPLSRKSSTRDSYYGNPEFDGYPVIYVSWDAASAYCTWAGRRLPSEAEWEKAAAWDAENLTHRLYPWGDDALDGTKANFCDANCKRDQQFKNAEYDDGYADTSPAGNYPAGASFYGALDMAGNVWEWVADWYDVYPGGDKTASNNFGQTYRVARGSSWFFPIEIANTSNRVPVRPDEPNDAIGFRCALSVSE